MSRLGLVGVALRPTSKVLAAAGACKLRTSRVLTADVVGTVGLLVSVYVGTEHGRRLMRANRLRATDLVPVADGRAALAHRPRAGLARRRLARPAAPARARRAGRSGRLEQPVVRRAPHAGLRGPVPDPRCRLRRPGRGGGELRVAAAAFPPWPGHDPVPRHARGSGLPAGALAASVLFAAGTVVNVAVGRLTFALGLAVGLAALAAAAPPAPASPPRSSWPRRRPVRSPA